MALRQRTVSGTIVDGNGQPITSALVKFSITENFGLTLTHVIVDRDFTALTDAFGAFSLSLWCDEDSLVAINYNVYFPIESSGQPDTAHLATFSLAYEDGSPVYLPALIVASVPAPSPDDLLYTLIQQMVDDAISGSSGSFTFVDYDNPQSLTGPQKAQARANIGAGTDTPAWSSLTGVPSTFPPSAHAHDYSELTGVPSTFAPSAHTHSYGSLTGIPSTFPPSVHTHDYSSLTGVPSTFTPAAHDHVFVDDITVADGDILLNYLENITERSLLGNPSASPDTPGIVELSSEFQFTGTVLELASVDSVKVVGFIEAMPKRRTANVNFGNGADIPQTVTITIYSADILVGDIVHAMIQGPADGRDSDEMEMEQFVCSVSDIVSNVSYKLTVTCLTEGAHGVYLAHIVW